MKKKILALVLAATMAFGASMTVLADDSTLEDSSSLTAGQEVTGDATVELPTLKVTVPTTTAIVINPYKISYTNETDSSLTGNSQIISAEQTIKNESNVAVAVNVSSLTGTPSEGLALATTDKLPATKSVFLYLEVLGSDGSFADAYNAKNANQLVVNTADAKAVSKDAIVTLAAGDSTATTAKFKFGGAAVVNPTKTGDNKTTVQDPWTDSDKVTVSLKFTFTPQAVE